MIKGVVKLAGTTKVTAEIFAPAPDWSIERSLSMSTSLRTRKMVNDAWEGRSQQGRLIEPSKSWFPPNFLQYNWSWTVLSSLPYSQMLHGQHPVVIWVIFWDKQHRQLRFPFWRWCINRIHIQRNLFSWTCGHHQISGEQRVAMPQLMDAELITRKKHLGFSWVIDTLLMI